MSESKWGWREAPTVPCADFAIPLNEAGRVCWLGGDGRWAPVATPDEVVALERERDEAEERCDDLAGKLSQVKDDATRSITYHAERADAAEREREAAIARAENVVAYATSLEKVLRKAHPMDDRWVDGLTAARSLVARVEAAEADADDAEMRAAKWRTERDEALDAHADAVLARTRLMEDYKVDTDALRAEVERLREALTEIASAERGKVSVVTLVLMAKRALDTEAP